MKYLLFIILVICALAAIDLVHADNKEFEVVYYSTDRRQLNCVVRAADKNLALVIGSDCCYAAMFDLPVADLIDTCVNPVVKERK
jgi:hypothetical protein